MFLDFSLVVFIFLYFWLFFMPVIILCFLGVKSYGVFTLSQFFEFDFDVTGDNLSHIFLVGFGTAFVGSAQGLYQAIKKSLTLLLMVIVTTLLGALLVFKYFVSFTVLLQIFLFITIVLSSMVVIYLICCLILDSKQLRI